MTVGTKLVVPISTNLLATSSSPSVYFLSASGSSKSISLKSIPYAPLIWTSIRPGERIFPPRSIVRDGGNREEKKDDCPEMMRPEEGDMNRSALIAYGSAGARHANER
jgi:hypothetical protein